MLRCNQEKIGKNCEIGDDVDITCDEIELGDEVIIGKGTTGFINGKLKIGDLSTIGPDTIIMGNNISIGSEFFGSGKLVIGPGGWNQPDSNLVIGDRCVMHNNVINLNRHVFIGNHVGLSPNVNLITHGYWQSILKGYPFGEGPIVIEDNVIIGDGSIILPGVTIKRDAVIGAGSVVTKDVEQFHVVAGVPAKTIYIVEENRLTETRKEEIARSIIEEYISLLKFKGINNVEITLDYPNVYLDGGIFNLEDETYVIKEHTEITDDFRDFIRRKGIWFYGRRFKSIYKKVIKQTC